MGAEQDRFQSGSSPKVGWAATEEQDARAFAVYSVWAQAQARFGVTVTPWPNVLQDDKACWLAVADALNKSTPTT